MNRNELKTERAKLKGMPLKDKLWYIWAYYKIPIMIFAASMFLLYEGVGMLYRNMQETMLYCAAVNEKGITSQALKQMQADFEHATGIDKTWKQTTEFDISLSIENELQNIKDSYYNSASIVKLQSLVGTGVLDTLISTDELHEYLAGQDLFLDLSECLPKSLYEQLDASGLLVWQADYSGNFIPCGISLEGSALALQLNLEDFSVLSVCSIDNHANIVYSFIEYALYAN